MVNFIECKLYLNTRIFLKYIYTKIKVDHSPKWKN